ncbi:M23 family metallopeptidase [Salmonirosea aquatica]|uniref:Peptidoglycan DD-metalloendopeptidase family protein n=1 Tax=Salmonirosea aquatica TaxID=2654236 RepID=A0A7C9BCE5_9BACT|nr:peptidoglycan DD-metalloendopeptidase family protein [Cytophagaceae bacterium SJW1-29]
MNRIVSTVVFVLIALTSQAQKESYPKNYFVFPITPGQPNTLAGVLGDLRTNHFHGGLDIRTQQREGLAVHAAADGYVYRVAVQGTGYGNVIYLRHPNGLTTVYGHLQKFSDSLAAYVRREQYAKEDFYVDLYPQPNQFPMKRGQIMALSGNTGGSGGPHLHFEIRDSRDNHLNPLEFEFRELKDNTSPAFMAVALRPATIDSRVNAQFERQVFKPVKQKDGIYRISQPIRATGQVGIELQAYDYMTGTGFRYGLHCIEISMDGKEIFTYNMEKFPSDVFRDYNNLIDYRTEQQTGARFYRCYNPDGNVFDLYKTGAYQGRLFIKDTLEHEITIKIFDSYENSALLKFTVQGEVNAPAIPPTEEVPFTGTLSAEMQDNVLKVTAPNYKSSTPFVTFFSNRLRIQKDPAYYVNNNAVFLTDLREFMPDSAQVGSKVLALDYKKSIAPGRITEYALDGVVIRFDSTTLFDTLHLTVRQRYNALTINEPEIPLRHYMDVRYRSEGPITRRERAGVYRVNGGGYSYLGGNWLGDVIAFRTRELGTFVVMHDTIPPRINLVEHSKGNIRAYIHDDRSGISTFRALVGGKWVLLNYEYKSSYLWSEKLDEGQEFAGELSLEVTDRAGNSTILQVEIEEPKPKPAPRKRTRR